jgi:hypothetical protein
MSVFGKEEGGLVPCTSVCEWTYATSLSEDPSLLKQPLKEISLRRIPREPSPCCHRPLSLRELVADFGDVTTPVRLLALG